MRIRSLCATLTLVVGAGLLASPSLYAQRSSTNSTLTLLQRSSIQEELELSEDQKTKLEELASSAKPDFKAYLEELRNLDAAGREAKKKEFNEQTAKKREEAGLKAREILSTDQRKAFDRILVRDLGVSGLLQGAIAGDLKLDEDQKTKIQELLDQRNKAIREQGFRASREERDKLRGEWDGKVLALLNPDQRSMWLAKAGPAPATGGSGAVAGTNSDGSTTAATPAAATGPAVASFGAPASGTDDQDPTKRKVVKTMSFNFKFAPWPLVLEMFADAAGLTLDMHDTPQGSFNHFDPNQYTARKALDVLNGYLLREGYLTVQKDGFLIVWAFDNGIPPSLVPEITADKLMADYADVDNQLLTVPFKIENGDVEQLAREADVMLDPYPFVRIAALTASNTLVVTDLSSNLRRLKGLIDASTGQTMFRQFPIKHMGADEANDLVRSQLGLPPVTPNVSESGRRRSSSTQQTAEGTNVTADSRTNSLLVSGTPRQIKLVEEILTAIDVGEGPNGETLAGRGSRVPYLEVYKMNASNVQEVAKTIDALMPGKIVNEDGYARKLHVKATQAEHEEIRALIKKLDMGGGGSDAVAVINLVELDALVATQMLTTMFTKESDGGPVIQADTFNQRLVCRGNAEQLDQIKTVLAQLGEDGTGKGRERVKKGPIRQFPMGGRNPREVLDLMEKMLSGPRSNRIRRVIPSQESLIKDQVVPGKTLEESFRPETPSKTGSTTKPGQRRTAGLPENVVYTFSALLQEDEPAKAAPPAAQAQDDKKSDSQDDLLKQFDEIVGGKQAATSAPIGDPNKPEVTITYSGDTLIVSSLDDDALARAEEMFDLLNQTMPVRTTWTIFYLTSADCTEAAAMLEQLFPTSSVATSVTDSGGGLLGGLSSGLSSFGDSIMDMTGLNTIGTGPQTLRIIPETRSNSLFVSGPEYLVQEVDEMLRILDMSDLPQSGRDLVPRPPIALAYADVADVAEKVTTLFKPYTEAQRSQGNQGNPFAMMMGGGGNSGNQGTPIRLTVAADDQTNQLHVACSEKLYREIKTFVESMEVAAQKANRGVRVYTLRNASAAQAVETLTSMLPRVRVSTTGANGGRPGFTAPSSSSSNSSAEQAMREAAARRAAFSSRFGGGRPSFGGGSTRGGSTRGSFGGGFPSRGGSTSGRSGFGGFGGSTRGGRGGR